MDKGFKDQILKLRKKGLTYDEIKHITKNHVQPL